MKIKEVGCKTDIGRVRDHNQDYYYIDVENNIFIIADGMGGQNGGGVASKTAVTSLSELLNENLKIVHKFSDEIIRESIKKTNEIVYTKALSDPCLKGMGTTLVATVFHDDHITIAHIGDSRAYLLRDRKIRRLTTDHSVVEALLLKGLITKEEVRNHHLRHVIANTIGTHKNVQPEINNISIQKGDHFLLCTDGLTEMLTDQEIESIINPNKNSQTICNALVDNANKKGGLDNITVLIIKF